MVATFCLRLALGMLGSLVLLSPKQMHPRFFRTHFLTALGLCLVAAVMAWGGTTGTLASVAAAATFLGAVVWIFERAPAGWTFLGLASAAVVAAFVLADRPSIEGLSTTPLAGRLADDLTAAALLGASMTAMLVGHSYLISPGLTIRPLMGQLALLGVATVLRATVAGAALWFWTADHDITNLGDMTVLLLPVRWLVGLAGPLAFGWLAYRCAAIRSTQSATGILYVVVIFAFLGELLSLVLLGNTGLPL